ncbi:OmpA family protein, partial [Actinotalea sp. AC32]|nr:OmpA family protein [Actinotalea sp. AC32]
DATDRPGVDVLTVDDLGGVPDDAVSRSVRSYAPGGPREYSGRPRQFDARGTITSVQQVQTRGDDVVVTLASDLLFDVDSAELADAARQRVTELVADVPQGATLAVDGHTDSVASDAYNQDLSQRRAQAVADVVAAARPDLALEVRGHGESALAVPESGDDVAEDRARNRRVELRHTAAGAVSTDTETARPEPVTGEHVPGEPRIREVDPGAVVVEHVVEVPAGDDAGTSVRVGVEPVVVRGSVARLRIHLTPLEGDGRHTVYGMTGEGSFYPQVIDPVHLTTYRVLRETGLEWSTSTVLAATVVDRPLRYEAYVARPLDDVTTVDVSVLPEWPRLEGVPVVRDE